MNHKEVSEWRDDIKSAIIETLTDVKWIKANLARMDGRQHNLEGQVSTLRALCSVVGVLLGSGLALVINIVMR